MHGMQKSVLVESIPADFEPERVICVDTASIAQMGTLADSFGASVDHEEDVYYGTENYIRANAAATGEIIFDLVKPSQARSALPLMKKCAFAFMPPSVPTRDASVTLT